MPSHSCGSSRITYMTWFSLSTMRGPGLELIVWLGRKCLYSLSPFFQPPRSILMAHYAGRDNSDSRPTGKWQASLRRWPLGRDLEEESTLEQNSLDWGAANGQASRQGSLIWCSVYEQKPHSLQYLDRYHLAVPGSVCCFERKQQSLCLCFHLGGLQVCFTMSCWLCSPDHTPMSCLNLIFLKKEKEKKTFAYWTDSHGHPVMLWLPSCVFPLFLPTKILHFRMQTGVFVCSTWVAFA